MSLEHSSSRQKKSRNTIRAAYTVDEFCEAFRVSRGALYKMWQEKIGPRWMWNGNRRIISDEAAADWRREREAAAMTEQALPQSGENPHTDSSTA